MIDLLVSPIRPWLSGTLLTRAGGVCSALGVPLLRLSQTERSASLAESTDVIVDRIRSVLDPSSTSPGWFDDGDPVLTEQLGSGGDVGEFLSYVQQDAQVGKSLLPLCSLYLPTRLAQPSVRVILGSSTELSMGSAISLLDELRLLRTQLGVEKDWGELKSGESMSTRQDPLATVKTTWAILHYAARIAIDSNLPLIIDY